MSLAFFLIVMGSHDRVLNREDPCAAIYFVVILLAAVCFTEFGGQKVAAGRPIMRLPQLSESKIMWFGLGSNNLVTRSQKDRNGKEEVNEGEGEIRMY